jgi:hypothetical protein
MPIFHNHIPRTSGEVINQSISRLPFVKSLIVKPTDIIGIEDFYNKDYICGHIGQYPKEILDNVISFSLVRDPYDQFMSWFWLMFMQGIWHGRPDNSGSGYDYMDYVLNTPEYFNGMSNMQSKFLTGSLDIDLWNFNINPIEKTKNDSCLVNYSFSESDLSDSLRNNIVHTVENRSILIEKINGLFAKDFGIENAIVDTHIPGHAHPKNHRYLFDVPNSWVDKIKSALEVDYYLYNKVLEQDKKHDIIIS